MRENWSDYLTFCIELAKDCGELIRPFAGKAGERSEKTQTDFATEMDFEAEELRLKSSGLRYDKSTARFISSKRIRIYI